ncbi:MAG: hypothetical protein V3R45_00045 [Candidatus Aminicenantaceae bacterium]
MKKNRVRLIALILVFSLVSLSGNLMAAERKGVKLIIQKTDGQEIKGELITVKSNSLLILDAETETDTTVNLNIIDVITVDNKSLMFELGVGGFLLMGATRLSLHSSLERVDEGDETATTHQVQDTWLWGAMGAGVGVLAGAVFGVNKTIRIQGESEADIQSAMEKLSKKARVKGIQ